MQRAPRARKNGFPAHVLFGYIWGMRLIAISWPDFFEGEAAAINAIFEDGLEILHLRKPGAKEEDVAALIEQIEQKFRKRLTLHYLPDLAERYAVGGYHLSPNRPPAPEGWGGRLSASCHSTEELEEKLHMVDYAFLSPIFDSISKSGYKSSFSYRKLQTAASEGIINERVVALGGVTPDNMGMAKELGFGGVAVLGGLWGDRSLEGVEKRYKEYVKRL